MNKSELLSTVQTIATRGKGILAADESTGTCGKRFASINTECNEENRRAYREMLFTTQDLGQYVCGVILFEETLFQKTADGTPFPQHLESQGVLPGIKVDKGLIDLALANGEKITQGLDGLPERLAKYKEAGAKFAKWRCVYNISQTTPSWAAMQANANVLARYAAICQEQGIVPIVEPEVLINGDHTIEQCEFATGLVLRQVFEALGDQGVMLEGIILKPSMIISGDKCPTQASPQEVAEATVRVLKRFVPAAVPTINFLSGGQTSEQATLHLDLMNKMGPLPWNLSFSYGRALQEHALKTWAGKAENVEAAQAAHHERIRLNGAASKGEYSTDMEKASA